MVIADDQTLVRGGFRLILGSAGIPVVAEAADGREAVAAALKHRPDVVLMDIRMPEMDGLEATRRILAAQGAHGEQPEVRIIILTTFDLDQYVYAALTAGASGFLLKDVSPEHLIAAVRLVRRGDALLAPSITRRLVERFAPRRQTDQGLSVLTPRELEVLGLIARGLSNAELAAALTLSEATVKTHVARILGKLGLRDRVQAVVLAYETGLVSAGQHGAGQHGAGQHGAGQHGPGVVSPPRLVGERLVDELAQLRADRVGARREQLGEERHGQAGLGVDPERGAGGAAPGQLARRAGDLARGRVDDDGEAEAEADAAERRLGVQRPPEGLQVLVRPAGGCGPCSATVRGLSSRVPSSSPAGLSGRPSSIEVNRS